MSAGAQNVDAQIGAVVLKRWSEKELLELFHAAPTPESRLRIIGEIGRRRREGGVNQ